MAVPCSTVCSDIGEGWFVLHDLVDHIPERRIVFVKLITEVGTICSENRCPRNHLLPFRAVIGRRVRSRIRWYPLITASDTVGERDASRAMNRTEKKLKDFKETRPISRHTIPVERRNRWLGVFFVCLADVTNRIQRIHAERCRSNRTRYTFHEPKVVAHQLEMSFGQWRDLETGIWVGSIRAGAARAAGRAAHVVDVVICKITEVL